MRSIVSFSKEVGDAGSVKGGVSLDGGVVKAQVEVSYPLEKVIEPAMKVVDDLVDKLEQLIPGDQKALATQAKADARAALVRALSGQ